MFRAGYSLFHLGFCTVLSLNMGEHANLKESQPTVIARHLKLSTDR